MVSKIKQEELQFALQIRKKKKECKGKTKLDLCRLLARDLVFEEEMDIKSESLYNMERKILFYERRKKIENA